jgi:cytochrome c-type biogenesis protein CcmH/NrfG
LKQESTDSSIVVIRAELSSRIREALSERDYAQLEHWAKQWIQLDPRNPSGFKWLARAATATQQISRAAYAYGRLLDFDPKNEEARKFFAQFPSTLQDQPLSVHQHLKSAGFKFSHSAQNQIGPQEAKARSQSNSALQMSAASRKHLAQLEYELGDAYQAERLFTQAGEAYFRSFERLPSRNAALGLAKCLHRQNRSIEGIKFLRTQLFQFPDWSEGRLLLGRLLFEYGHRSEAQREWQLILEREPENTQALAYLKSLSHFVQS